MSSDAPNPFSSFDLKHSVVLVTGGSKGIGRGIAAAFFQAGAQVIICGRNAPVAPLEGAAFISCDVRRPDAVAAMIDSIARTYGRLDAVINNAGGAPPAAAATASPRFSESVLALNLLGPLHVSQAANHVMQNSETGGAIVNISSISGTRPSPGTAVYGAAKAGLLNLTQSLAMEWGPKVRVNAIIAGLIVTENATDHYGGAEGVTRIGAMLPLARMGTPADIASACLFLASPLAAYISGAQMAVHGGGERPQFLNLAEGA